MKRNCSWFSTPDNILNGTMAQYKYHAEKYFPSLHKLYVKTESPNCYIYLLVGSQCMTWAYTSMIYDSKYGYPGRGYMLPLQSPSCLEVEYQEGRSYQEPKDLDKGECMNKLSNYIKRHCRKGYLI